jgi:hypothetical protein
MALNCESNCVPHFLCSRESHTHCSSKMSKSKVSGASVGIVSTQRASARRLAPHQCARGERFASKRPFPRASPFEKVLSFRGPPPPRARTTGPAPRLFLQGGGLCHPLARSRRVRGLVAARH